jgi:hypothetical protein
MTRHEADRAHEASGIAFTFAGHLVWGNPVLSEGLHGDVEAWRCGECHGLVVGETVAHAEQHVNVDELDSRLSTLALAFDQIAHGAFKPSKCPARCCRISRRPSANVATRPRPRTRWAPTCSA